MRGVYQNKKSKLWFARIRHNGERLVFGPFNSAEHAARAHDKAAIKYHGETAITNYPRGDYQ